MRRRLIPTAVALAGAAAGLALGGTGWAGGARPAAGDPARGELVWTTAGCAACHAFSKAGSSAKNATAPDLDRWLVPHARQVELPVELFAYGRIVWGGKGMSAYGPQLSAQDVEDLVSFVVGKPFSAPPGGVAPVAPLPPPPPLLTAPAATVSRWVTLERLSRRAAEGAALFAAVGCLSCHTYLGAGVRRLRARDLGSAGRTGRSARFFERYVARPYAYGNDLMPSYADLGRAALGRIAAFLTASRARP